MTQVRRETAMQDVRRELHHGDRVVLCHSHRPSSVNELLDLTVEAGGGNEAVVEDADRLTYEEMSTRVGVFASRLRSAGVRAGDRVALLAPNSIAFVISFLGILRIDAIVVPLNVREQQPEVRHILNDCSASHVVYAKALEGILPHADSVPSLRGALEVEAMLATDVETSADPSVARPAATGDDPAAIVYTSGTTGRPKGAVLSHFALVSTAVQYLDAFALDATDRMMVAVPLTHVTGLTACLLTAVAAGAAVIIAPEFRASTFLALAESEEMTATVMVPAMYKLLLISGDLAKTNLESWRLGGFGGGPMSPSFIEELTVAIPTLRLMNCYGATETCGAVVMMPPGEMPGREASIGRPAATAEILVMDEEGRELPAGCSGELWIRSPTNATGYWGADPIAAGEFAGGFWRSGDVGIFDEEGYLHLVDRKKGIINRGGYKISSVEVENVLNSHPAVIESAAFGRLCEVLGQRVVAVVVTRETVAEEELRDLCRRILSDYKVPERIEIRMKPLPRNANGKVLKRILLEESSPSGHG